MTYNNIIEWMSCADWCIKLAVEHSGICSVSGTVPFIMPTVQLQQCCWSWILSHGPNIMRLWCKFGPCGSEDKLVFVGRFDTTEEATIFTSVTCTHRHWKAACGCSSGVFSIGGLNCLAQPISCIPLCPQPRLRLAPPSNDCNYYFLRSKREKKNVKKIWNLQMFCRNPLNGWLWTSLPTVDCNVWIA